MEGKFIPSSPASVYPVLLSHLNGKAIAGVYSDAVIHLPDDAFEAIDLINAKASRTLIVNLARPMGSVEVSVFDVEGNLTDQHRRTLGANIHKFEAPPSGRVEIRKR
jgi:hypothetical protein